MAIVHGDVRHGNGSQAVFWDDSPVLTISMDTAEEFRAMTSLVLVSVVVGLVCALAGRRLRIVHDGVPVTVTSAMMLAMLLGAGAEMVAAGLGLGCLLLCGAARGWTSLRAHRAVTMLTLIPLLIVHAAATPSLLATSAGQPLGSVAMDHVHVSGGSGPPTLAIVAIYAVISLGAGIRLVSRVSTWTHRNGRRHALAELGEMAAGVTCVILMV